MNLILLFTDDFGPQGYQPNSHVTLTDRRFLHIKQVQQPSLGDQLKVGLLNGDLGSATVIACTDNSIILQVSLDSSPPPALPMTLILALPRPKMLKRILQTSATMGVKKLYLINALRVDKSYWSSPVLDAAEEHLLLGLEQAGDTVMPRIELRKRFKPFVEDELPAITAGTRALVAHPYHADACPIAENSPTTLAIGPEGGFIPYEIEKLQQAGMRSIHIGKRILRVETAVPALLSRLFPV
ncbi:16S rRNA (uracil(1498)-N(3))-methyltransferase [Pontibacter sp. JAM-7]|uniref:16S rRNA (uracil(1498)-N(3))-methyltransferase n=1 Tax=Pontibacter sp. JAM-7 TaxID=3366581 RepID=UPI003AF86DB6